MNARIWKYLRHLGWLPLIFAAIFGLLIVRARMAFGEWPRLSGNDPWALVNRSQPDSLSPYFSNSNHIESVYLLVPLTLVPLIAIPIWTWRLWRQKQTMQRAHWIQLGGCLAASALFLFQKGRFLWWFLD